MKFPHRISTLLLTVTLMVLCRTAVGLSRIFGGVDYLPTFKRLMGCSTDDNMDQLAARYTGFYQYAKILKAVAAGIRSGKIVVPK
jgi:hypothetical protein